MLSSAIGVAGRARLTHYPVTGPVERLPLALLILSFGPAVTSRL